MFKYTYFLIIYYICSVVVRMKRLFISILMSVWAITLAAGSYEYGLKVVTYPSGPDSFTGLTLEGGKAIPAKNSPFTVNFEMLNRRDNVFGCIFRIITDNGDNIDLMYTADREDNRYPILVCGGNVTEIPARILFDRWIPVSITLNTKNGEVSMNYNGTSVSIKDAGTKGANGFRVSFGMCRFDGYALDDVASFNIREISILRGSREIRRWALSKHDDYRCLDDLENSPAIAVNPSWIIDRYITWNEVLSEEYDSEPSASFSPVGDRLYVTTDGSWVDCFNLDTVSCSRIAPIGGIAPINAPDQLLCTRDGLFAYNVDSGSFAMLEGERWTGCGKTAEESYYWNKTSSWWEDEEALVSFGGYGFYHYNNEMIVQYPHSDKENVKLTLDDIHPRYSAASAIVDGRMFIFGGRGNQSGKQELSPKKYYDLHSVDLKTHEVEKIWEFTENPTYEFVPGGNMVYDSDENSFYVFTDMEGGTLISISPDHPGYRLMSLPSMQYHNAQYSFLNLCRSADGHSLYGLIIQSRVDGHSTVKVLNINYPPIEVSSMRQTVSSKEDDTSGGLPVRILVCMISAVVLCAGTWIVWKRIQGKNKTGYGENDEESSEHPEPIYDFSRSSICFFGGFCVKDRNGRDITSSFTPTLKALTVLLILYTEKDANGIISNKLNRILWPYKPEDTANNNRNVYVSKLRPLLEEVGDVSIVCQNRFWSIQFGQGVMCDYIEAMRLLRDNSNEGGINNLLELLLSGMMLPNMEQDWVDDFKGAFSNATIDFLIRQLSRKDLSQDIRINICDTVFQHDFLNEEALKVKCSTLYLQGKVGLAKTAYDAFCKEYKISLGMDYSKTLKELVS